MRANVKLMLSWAMLFQLPMLCFCDYVLKWDGITMFWALVCFGLTAPIYVSAKVRWCSGVDDQ